QLPIARSTFMQKLIKLLPGGLKWRLNRFRPQPVGDEGLIPELLALPTTRSKKPGICHFIYGEDTYFYTPLWQHAKQKIIATYHYPPQRLNERVSRPVLKGLSAVILMSQSQRAWFEQYLPPEKVFVVNHHVNTEFFHPLQSRPALEPIRIMSVGGILRDMNLLLKVVQLLSKRLGTDKIQFDFLIPKEFRKPFEGISNVNFYARISDEELRSLYQNATLGFMPLVDCTANNAILEMMACGKAIACSNVGGISDYVDEIGAMMFAPDLSAESLVNELMDLLAMPEQLARMGEHNRAKALSEFSLEKTTENLFDVYQQVAAQN
ncbi:MAG: glycosyltransferase involved in cell wall biosynthesis, partial [Paraglaciecola sp.]